MKMYGMDLQVPKAVPQPRISTILCKSATLQCSAFVSPSHTKTRTPETDTHESVPSSACSDSAVPTQPTVKQVLESTAQNSSAQMHDHVNSAATSSGVSEHRPTSW